MEKTKTCSFTGHRQIRTEDTENLKSLLKRGVKYAYDQGCRRFLAGGAIGFDTLAAEAVLELRDSFSDARLVLVLPCRDQDRYFSPEQKKIYKKILKSADELIYTGEVYTDTCMQTRNRFLAQNADIMLAYLYRERSGASQTVRLARENGAVVYNLCRRSP
jgi:uncharacterized phage-like protein YoqJ